MFPVRKLLLSVPALLAGPALVLLSTAIYDWSAAGGLSMMVILSLMALRSVWARKGAQLAPSRAPTE
jgi:hypothetical protein